MTVRNLEFRLTGKDAGASKALDGVGKKADGIGKKFKNMGGDVKAGIAGFAGGALVVGGKAILGMATQMEALDAKAKTVFGGSIGTVDKWAKANAGAMGLTKKEATGLAAGFADLLIPMGFTQEQAAKMSTETVGLSGALSQWSGGQVSAAEASDILAKAMLGETDGLKSLGIAISAEDIAARLAAKGQDKLTGAALAQAKAQATQALVMEKSVDAQKAYAGEGSKLIKMQAKASAQVKEFRDKAIAALIPILIKAGEWVVKNQDQIKALAKSFGEAVLAIGKIAGPVVVGAFRVLGQVIGTAKDVFGTLTTVIEGIETTVRGVLTFVVDKFLGFFQMLIDGATTAFSWVPGIGGKLKDAQAEFAAFRDEVNASLSGIKDKTVVIRISKETEDKRDKAAAGRGPAIRPVQGTRPSGRRSGGGRFEPVDVVDFGAGLTPARPRRGNVVTVQHNVDGRSLATATSRAQVGMRSRGYLPAMP